MKAKASDLGLAETPTGFGYEDAKIERQISGWEWKGRVVRSCRLIPGRCRVAC